MGGNQPSYQEEVVVELSLGCNVSCSGESCRCRNGERYCPAMNSGEKNQYRLSLTRHSMVTAVSLSEMSFTWVCAKSKAAVYNWCRLKVQLDPFGNSQKPRLARRVPLAKTCHVDLTAAVTVARVGQDTRTRQEALLTFLLRHDRRTLSDYNSADMPPY